MTTLPKGAKVVWANDLTGSNDKLFKFTAAAGSGTLTCGTTVHTVTPTPDDGNKAFHVTLPGTDDGTAACGAETLTLVMNSYTSTNTAADYTMTFVCMACSAASCDNPSTLTSETAAGTWCAVTSEAAGK